MNKTLWIAIPLLATAFAALAYNDIHSTKTLPAIGTVQVAFPPDKTPTDSSLPPYAKRTKLSKSKPSVSPVMKSLSL